MWCIKQNLDFFAQNPKNVYFLIKLESNFENKVVATRAQKEQVASAGLRSCVSLPE